MKDLIHAPIIIALLAQIPSEQSAWERLGISGLCLAVTAYLWNYFTKAQVTKDAANAAERDRLLAEGNEKTQQVIDLLTKQLDAKDVCKFKPLDNNRCINFRAPGQTSELPS